jgi:hypothetical protein
MMADRLSKFMLGTESMMKKKVIKLMMMAESLLGGVIDMMNGKASLVFLFKEDIH